MTSPVRCRTSGPPCLCDDHVPSCFQAAKQEMERHQREEWEHGKREELGRRKEGEQEEISRLRAKKKSLELELQDVVRHSEMSTHRKARGAH